MVNDTLKTKCFMFVLGIEYCMEVCIQVSPIFFTDTHLYKNFMKDDKTMKFLRGLLSEFLNLACFILGTKHMAIANYMLKADAFQNR